MSNFIAEDFKKILHGKNYTAQLILVNALIFIVLNIILAASSHDTGLTVLRNIGLPAGLLTSLTKIWTYFTYMFVHEGFFHFLFNMLWLYWMGRILADIYGQNRVLLLYIFGGLAGGIAFTLVSAVPIGLIGQGSFLIGASGGVLAVMVGTATLLPDYEIRLLFIGNVKLKYIALAGFILSTVLDFTQNFGGKTAHFGGALFGFIYGVQLKKGSEITDGPMRFVNAVVNAFKPGKKMKVVHNEKKKQKRTSEREFNSSTLSDDEIQSRIDIILDKISKSGYDSLTKEEKDFLFTMSKR